MAERQPRMARATARGWFRGQRFRKGQTLMLRPTEDTPPWAEDIDTPTDMERTAQGKGGRVTFKDVMQSSAQETPRNATTHEPVTLADSQPATARKARKKPAKTAGEEMMQ